MSIRTALAKLSVAAAGGALVGGGAVHVAEKPSTSRPQYVKHVKAAAAPRKAVRRIAGQGDDIG